MLTHSKVAPWGTVLYSAAAQHAAAWKTPAWTAQAKKYHLLKRYKSPGWSGLLWLLSCVLSIAFVSHTHTHAHHPLISHTHFSTPLFWLQVGKRLPKKYSIEGDLREALYGDCNLFIDAVGEADFLGGSTPNLGDLAVFGVLRAVEGTPTFEDAMANSRITAWYQRMAKHCVPARLPASAEAVV